MRNPIELVNNDGMLGKNIEQIVVSPGNEDYPDRLYGLCEGRVYYMDVYGGALPSQNRSLIWVELPKVGEKQDL